MGGVKSESRRVYITLESGGNVILRGGRQGSLSMQVLTRVKKIIWLLGLLLQHGNLPVAASELLNCHMWMWSLVP